MERNTEEYIIGTGHETLTVIGVDDGKRFTIDQWKREGNTNTYSGNSLVLDVSIIPLLVASLEAIQIRSKCGKCENCDGREGGNEPL